MTNIIIIGAGGHAAEIDEYIQYSQKVSGVKRFNIIGFLDDSIESYKKYKFSAIYLGGIQNHNIIKGQHYFMGIAGIQLRKLFINKFRDAGAEFDSFVHCSAYVSESASIGEGTIIGPSVNVGPNVKIGVFNLINSRCSLGHDTVIGNFNIISPNVCFSGFTKVGDENLFGISSVTIPGISIGSRNKIAAGMILDQDVADDSVTFYRFKEKVIAIPKR